MRILQGLFQLSAVVAYITNVVQGENQQTSDYIPLFFNDDPTQTNSNGHNPKNKQHCKQASKNNKLASGCIQVKLNLDAINFLTNNTDDTTIAMFDLDNEIGNELLLFREKSLQYTNNSNYNYTMAKVITQSGREGVVVYDTANKMAMTVNRADGILKIQPCPKAKNADCYVVVKIDGDELNKYDLPDISNDKPLKLNSTRSADQSEINVFRLSFWYDKDSVDSLGAANLLTNAALLTSIVNRAMINSEIPQIIASLHSANVYPLTVPASGALGYFSGYNLQGADIGVLISTQLSGICGMAYLYCNQYEGLTFGMCPYLVLLLDCTENSIAHEFAHLFGCNHNVENASNSPFQYGHGYINTSTNIRTIMSYESGTTERILYYSSDVVRTDRGYVLGNANTDNRRVLISQAAIFAQKLHVEKVVLKPCPSKLTLNGLNKYTAPIHVNTISFKVVMAKQKNKPKLSIQLPTNTSKPLTFSIKLVGGDICKLNFVNNKQVHVQVSNSRGRTKRNTDVYSDAATIFTGDFKLAGNRNLEKIRCQHWL